MVFEGQLACPAVPAVSWDAGRSGRSGLVRTETVTRVLSASTAPATVRMMSWTRRSLSPRTAVAVGRVAVDRVVTSALILGGSDSGTPTPGSCRARWARAWSSLFRVAVREASSSAAACWAVNCRPSQSRRVRRCCGLRRRSALDTGSPGAGGCRSKAVRKRCHGERAYSWAHARTQLTGSGVTATSGQHSQARQKAYSTDSKARPRCPVSRCVWWTRSGAACTYSASKAASGVDAARNASAGERGTTSGSTDWPSPAPSAKAWAGHRTGRSAGYGGGSFECSDLRMRSSPDLSRGFPTTDVHVRNGIRRVPCTCRRGVMSRGRHPPGASGSGTGAGRSAPVGDGVLDAGARGTRVGWWCLPARAGRRAAVWRLTMPGHCPARWPAQGDLPDDLLEADQRRQSRQGCRRRVRQRPRRL